MSWEVTYKRRGSGPVIIWASRHEPLPAQLRELERIYGDPTVVQLSGFLTVEGILEWAERLGARVIVPVLPLSMVARLVEEGRKRGVEVVWAEMEQVKLTEEEPRPGVDYNPDVETCISAREPSGKTSYKVMRFKRFHRVKAVKLELEPL